MKTKQIDESEKSDIKCKNKGLNWPVVQPFYVLYM